MALAAARPEVFAAQVAWTKVAFAARGVPIEDLEWSLRALRRAVVPAMAPEDAPLVESYIDRAQRHISSAPSVAPSRQASAMMGPRGVSSTRSTMAAAPLTAMCSSSTSQRTKSSPY